MSVIDGRTGARRGPFVPPAGRWFEMFDGPVLAATRHDGTAAVEHLGSYLYRAAVNTALDVLRARREAVPLEEVEAALAQAPALDGVSQQELRGRLRAA